MGIISTQTEAETYYMNIIIVVNIGGCSVDRHYLTVATHFGQIVLFQGIGESIKKLICQISCIHFPWLWDIRKK